MKNIIFTFTILGSLFLLTTGCTTSSIMGLSRASYVEELEQRQTDRLAELQENENVQGREFRNELDALRNKDDSRLSEMQTELADLRIRMEEIQILSDQIDSIIADLNTAEEDREELKILAEKFKIRMESIHKDTLSELVVALEQYMNDSESLQAEIN